MGIGMCLHAQLVQTKNNQSFIHSYSFNVQVDITQLQTDREARRETELFIYVAVSSN